MSADGRWHSAGRGDLPAAVQHLPARPRHRAVARGVGELVRYADDGVVLCRTRRRPRRPWQRSGRSWPALGLRLHPDKTRMVDLGRAGRASTSSAAISVPACRVGCGSSADCALLPAPLARAAGDEAAPGEGPSPHRSQPGRGADIRDVIEELNPILRGWGNYFRTGNAANKFRQIDDYVVMAAAPLDGQEAGSQPAGRAGEQWTEDWFNGLRPAPAPWHHPLPEGGVTMSRRPSVSRMRENRTHGLKGGWGNGSALRTPRP